MVGSTSQRRDHNARSAWEAARDEAKLCPRCDLHKCGTQTVFGEGPLDSPLLLVGEQPGDQEDRAGRPFVGPAGKILDRALDEAGVDRSQAYVTNAVKHFKFEQRGKRRVHSKPNAGEITACRWWLEQELALVQPKVVVALGATAARSVLGKLVTIGKVRGQAISLDPVGEAFVTIHPSFLLRVQDREVARQEFDHLVADLRKASQRASTISSST